ncbi:hypothetical protein JCM10369A_43990 [Nocardioides pyridinolyticus]
MEPVGLGLLVLGAVASSLWAARRERRRYAKTVSVRRDLAIADQRVEREWRHARRAMNDAAGQSWRNLAG